MKDSAIHIAVKILLYWYIFIYFSTEIFSYLHILERKYIFFGELFFWLALLFFLRGEILQTAKNINIKSKSILIILTLFLLTFIQGFFSAPNTTDSMVYHLPRIMYWVQEKTLYQDVIRNPHDFMPPFGEYIMLHLYFITGSDRLLFFSQWIAYVATVIISGVIAYQLGAGKKNSYLVSLFVALIPIIVLQSTNTKVDLVVTCLVVICIYIALRFQEENIREYLALAFGLGLGLLTKQTFLIYAVIPLGIILFKLLKGKKNLLLFFIMLLIILLIQSRLAFQNVLLYGNIIGSNTDGSGRSVYTNQNITPVGIISNVVKNTMIHIPAPIFTKEVEDAIRSFHDFVGKDINDCSTTFCGEGFEFRVVPIIYPQEDIASNPLQLLVVFIGGIVLIRQVVKGQVNPWLFLLYILAVTSYIFFSAILKWQPFHSRLHTPFFVIGTISSVLILSQFKKGIYLLKGLILLSVPLAILLILLNFSRPYISYALFYDSIKSFSKPLSNIPGSFFTKPRVQQYFNSRNYWYMPYSKLTSLVAQQNYKGKIAFNLVEGFEYPLWVLIKENNIDVRVIPYSQIDNTTLIISTSYEPFYKKEYDTRCIKTDIEYGYACISERK